METKGIKVRKNSQKNRQKKRVYFYNYQVNQLIISKINTLKWQRQKLDSKQYVKEKIKVEGVKAVLVEYYGKACLKREDD